MATFSTHKLARLTRLLSAKNNELADAIIEHQKSTVTAELRKVIKEIHTRIHKVYRKLGKE